LLVDQARPGEALAELEKEPEPVWHAFGLPIVYHALGKKREADSAQGEFIRNYGEVGAYQVAVIYAYRGDADRAFEWLEKAYALRDGGLAEMKGEPLLRSIEKDPRYSAFMKKMNLPL